MSRSGYSDDYSSWDLIRWRGAVKSAIRGKRGQAFMQEMATAMDAMPQKSLIAEELEQEGEVCALGSVGKSRGMDMSNIDVEDPDSVAHAFKIPLTLACEVMYMNDEGPSKETPEHRWTRIRAWIQKQIKVAPTPAIEVKA